MSDWQLKCCMKKLWLSTYSNACPFSINTTKTYKAVWKNSHSICQSPCLHLYSYPHSIISPLLMFLFNNRLYLLVSLQYEHVQQFCSDPADLSLSRRLECCLLHHPPPLHPHHPLPRHTGIPLWATGLRLLHQNQNRSWPAPPPRWGGLVVTMVTADTVSIGTTVDWWKRLQIWTELYARLESLKTRQTHTETEALYSHWLQQQYTAQVSPWLKILHEI